MDWPFLKKDIQYILLNRIVCEIPSWHIRRLFYRLCGMKIHESAMSIPGDSEPPFRRHSTAVPF